MRTNGLLTILMAGAVCAFAFKPVEARAQGIVGGIIGGIIGGAIAAQGRPVYVYRQRRAVRYVAPRRQYARQRAPVRAAAGPSGKAATIDASADPFAKANSTGSIAVSSKK